MKAISKPKYRRISDIMIHPPKVIKSLFGSITWNINTENKVIYLTFDDGPIPIITEKILKALSIFNAKATFFCVGENVKKYPSIYKEILSEGHSTGNHTFSHLAGLKTDTKTYVDNVERAKEYINSNLFRPPHGRMRKAQQNIIQKNYDIILWDVLSLDYDNRISEKTCFNNVTHFTRPGSVIVFHDNIKAEDNMFYALTQTLHLYTEMGYKFEALNSQIVKKVKNRKTQTFFNLFF